MTTYPDSLPLPIRTSYAIGAQSNLARTAFETGPVRLRRRTTTSPSTITVSWIFDSAQLALFEGWYEHQLKDGSSWFEIKLLGGQGISTHNSRFDNGYTQKPLSAITWQVDASLSVRQRPIYSAAGYSLAEQLPDDSSITSFENNVDALGNAIRSLPLAITSADPTIGFVPDRSIARGADTMWTPDNNLSLLTEGTIALRTVVLGDEPWGILADQGWYNAGLVLGCNDGELIYGILEYSSRIIRIPISRLPQNEPLTIIMSWTNYRSVLWIFREADFSRPIIDSLTIDSDDLAKAYTSVFSVGEAHNYVLPIVTGSNHGKQEFTGEVARGDLYYQTYLGDS